MKPAAIPRQRIAPISHDDGFPPLMHTGLAIEFLAKLGIYTSRDLLDDLRKKRKLGWHEGRGAHKILYTKDDLLDYFSVKQVPPCRLEQNPTPDPGSINVVDRTLEQRFAAALARGKKR